jgi:uncharacterized protein Yka (UPF0111/DUF47 family)
MSIKSLFKTYIVPHEINFLGMLQEQSLATYKIIDDLYDCFIKENETACDFIKADEHKTKEIKNKNMHTLLNAFITPIDRESIYRAITQLDWITLSAKHFVLEVKAYEIHNLNEYKHIFHLIHKSAETLNKGFEALSYAKNGEVPKIADKTRNIIEHLNQAYIEEMVKLSKESDFQKVFVHKEILSQLKEIGKRIHICANTLQDIVVKMD